MKPSDLGLPPRFSEWRKNQEKAILDATCAGTRFRMLNAPPGVGKSAIYVGLARMLGGRTLVLTRTKALQDQLVREFGGSGLVEVKGQGNYACHYSEEEEVRCDEGPCHAGVECALRSAGCTYYDAVRDAARSEMVVTNYAYWMSMNRYAEPRTLGQYDLLVLDEAHEAATALANFVSVRLRSKDMSMLGRRLLRDADIDAWSEWAAEILPSCREVAESARKSGVGSQVDRIRRLTNLERNLADLARARQWKRTDAPDPPAWIPGTDTDWAIEEKEYPGKSGRGVLFQPVWAAAYAESYLFSKIPNVVLTSATVTPRDAKYLGIPADSVYYREYPSPFRKEARPVYVVPAASVGRNMSEGEIRVWINRIDQILETELEKGHKGIIHTVSYERASRIMRSSRHSDVMVTHSNRSVQRVVDEFKEARGPLVLVSPSVGTGFDFKGDTARFQIIAKLPFIDSRPPVVQKRHRSDKRYLDHETVVSLIQQAGRGVRSERDWCRTYITDDNFGWFMARNKDMFPKWFKTAIRRVRSVAEISG